MDIKLINSFDAKVASVRKAMKALFTEGEFHNTIINENITYNRGEEELNGLEKIFTHLLLSKTELETEFIDSRGLGALELVEKNIQLRKDIKFLIGIVDKEKAKEYPINMKNILMRQFRSKSQND